MEFMKGLLQPSKIGLLLFGFAIIYLVIGAIVNYRKLRQFKGPLGARVSRIWLFWHECRGRLDRVQVEVLKKYGSVCRIGPNLLQTDDPEILRHISAPGSRWTRGTWYDAMKMDPRLDTVFSTRDEKLHADLKAEEAGGYHGRDISTLEPDMDARILDMIELITATYKGVSMDLAVVTRFFTLDALSTVAFGRPFGFMAANKDLWDFNKSNSDFLLVLSLSLNHPWIAWILALPWVQTLAGPKETEKTGFGPAVGFARKAVAERYGNNPKVKNDMLGSFVNKGLSQLQCEAEAFLQILAGSESTTTALRTAMFSLIGNPPAYAKLRAEIDAAYSQQRSGAEIVRYADAQKLPYLNACIWEALRMYPPLFGLQSKLAPPEGDTIKGIHFPGGIEVAICDEAVCRREDVFEPDCHTFPTRSMDRSERRDSSKISKDS